MRLSDLRISAKLSIMVGLSLLGFVVFGILAYSTINEVKINGQLYQDISMGKSLQSDVEPPNLYLTDAQSDVYLLLIEGEAAKYNQAISAYNGQKKKFEDSMQRYRTQLPDGQLKQALQGGLYQEGEAWMQVIDKEVIPAKLRGDDKGALAAFQKDAIPHFDAHHAAVNELDKAVQDVDTKKEEDAARMISSRMTILLLTGLGIMAAIAFFAWFTGRLIVRSLGETTSLINELAANNLEAADVKVMSGDEIGLACAALNKMKNNLRATIESIAGSAQNVASASEELSATSQQISANSQETSAQAAVVSRATQQVSQNLQTVATGAEQMGASIKDIARNATEAAKVATLAVRTTEETNVTVQKLGQSSMEIGQVVKLITSVAEQTNLLALNSTIEAARAGEAGKGFAVVANEVKELAKQSAKATEQISQRIQAIQSDTKAAVEAIGSIKGVIQQINDISGTIATAVEEQNATTNEMVRSVSDAAQGSGEITSNIAGVAQAAESTSRGAGDTQKAVEDLVETSVQLRRLVEQFKIEAHGSEGKRYAQRN